MVVADGRGSPRDGLYKDYSDEEMRLVPFKEQRKSAVVGEFAAHVMLDFPNKFIKHASRPESVEDILGLIRATTPQIVYTDTLADKHDTHVGVALRVIDALRKLDQSERPTRFFGSEVWRTPDRMLDADKAQMSIFDHENIQFALLGVYDSQITAGKRYDLTSMGGRHDRAVRCNG